MSENNLRSCLQALRSATSDNERFAALMMVTKLVKAEHCEEQTRREILESLGFHFLTRLMKTTTVPDGCPSSIYKSIALSILSSFIQDPAVVSNPELKKQVTVFNEIILGHFREEGDEDADTMMSDCYDCLRGMLLSPVSRQFLIEGGAQQALVQVIVTQQTGCERAMEILLELLRQQRSGVWYKHHGDAHKLLRYLVTSFRAKQDDSKFALGDMLTVVLSTVEKGEGEPHPDWVKDLVQDLYDVVRCKLDDSRRDSILGLVSSLVSCQGVTCLLPPLTADTKLILLVTHMACIEVRMVLEDGRSKQVMKKSGVVCSCYGLLEHVLGHMTTGESLGLTMKQVGQLHSAMVGAFNSVIFFLSQVEQQEIQLLPGCLLVTASVRVLGAWLAEETTALRDEVYKLLPFLVQICKQQIIGQEDSSLSSMADLSISGTNASQHDDGQKTTNISNSCDTKTNSTSQSAGDKSETEKMDTVESGEQKSDKSTDNQTGIKDENSKCVRFKEEDDSTDSALNGTSGFKDSNLDLSLVTSGQNVDLIKFLLPAMSHLTAEDKPREILLQENMHSVLIDYFHQQMAWFLDHRDEPELKDSLASLCSIFLNLTVTEPVFVSKHHKFTELLSNVIGYLAKTVHDTDVLILTANFVTLGLMMFRHLGDKSGIQQDSRDQFTASCISFLSKAHSRVKRKTPILAVSESYATVWEDISELWFLSMQALSALTAIHASVSTLVMKSGWVPAVIRILLDVQGAGVHADYQSAILSLLATLAINNTSAKRVIREKRGIELAQMYAWENLQAVLTN